MQGKVIERQIRARERMSSHDGGGDVYIGVLTSQEKETMVFQGHEDALMYLGDATLGVGGRSNDEGKNRGIGLIVWW